MQPQLFNYVQVWNYKLLNTDKQLYTEIPATKLAYSNDNTTLIFSLTETEALFINSKNRLSN